MTEKLIHVQNLYGLLEVEPYFLLSALFLLAWLFYRFFLTEVSEERHRNLKGHFQNILRHYLIFSSVFAIFILLNQIGSEWTRKSLPYLGVFALIWGMIVFVKTCRLITLQYLFLGSMSTGVPVLIVNIFSLVLSLALVLWTANQIFGLQVAPLLATSAAFSIILGLAIQDTLGNLFAGISLQLDKSFEIGDWVEVVSGIQKSVGQVREISWRATVLMGLSDELITIPNRFLAGAQISNFSDGGQPLIRSQSFRMGFDVDTDLVKRCLSECTKGLESIRKYPEAYCYIADSNENGITYKLVYFIDNYGSQWKIGDIVIDSAIKYLMANGIEPAPARLQILKNV
jgi:small-conductance mechanosensitive channel